MFTDAQLLDFLDNLELPRDDYGWIARESKLGRGFRLHTTTRQEMDRFRITAPIHKTARKAIEHFMFSIGEDPRDTKDIVTHESTRGGFGYSGKPLDENSTE